MSLLSIWKVLIWKLHLPITKHTYWRIKIKSTYFLFSSRHLKNILSELKAYFTFTLHKYIK